ncbi:OmpW family outer membrane protein [Halomonas sp. CS7]|uniref:OmpW family outer membrane protein n=1 Tax=Halomonas pelophila TaxID=3151122 RepID=A0ABV1N142_9GAMM
MNSRLLIATVALATAGLATAPVAMAYQAGDIVLRGGIAKAEVTDDIGSLDVVGELEVSDERGMAYSVGYLFSDRLGVELNGTEAVEHRLSTAALGGVDRLPVNLMINYYPMGGSVSRIQPYVGAGLNYTHFSEEELEGLDVDKSYGLAGQVGLEMAVTHYLLVGAFARYANVDADVSIGGTALGEADIDPMTLGGGATFRF